MERLLLMLPGPMQIPDEVAEAALRPLFFHRSERFRAFRERLGARMRPLFGTSSDVLFLSGSGTAAMESAIVNMTSPGEEILVMVGGVFAERWAKIGAAFGLNVRVCEVEWPYGPTVEEVRDAMDRWPGARVVFLTWSESSTGVLVELPEIGRAVRDAGRWLVADAVSGLAVSPLRMDDWEIDVVVAGSQKGLMLPPGLGLVAVGERAWEKSAGAGSPRFSLDWASHRDGVPSTPALSLMQQLDAALDLMDAMGPGGVFMRREVVANRIRALVRGAGLELYAKRPGNGVTSLVAPPGMDAGRFREILEEDYSILIEGGLGRLEGRILRIGHPGHVTDEELDYFSRSFISALRKLMPSWQAAEKPDGR